MRLVWCLTVSLLLAQLSPAAIRLMVTVTDQRTGEPVTNLSAGDFLLTDSGSPRRIEAVKFETGAVDVMLLVDASLAGQMVQQAAGSMVEQLGEKEQMAVVAFHSTPDLVQDFTASKQLLSAAIGQIKFGNDPRMLDAVFAAADGGFEHSTWRRVIVLITAGIEGRSRVSEASVVRVARKNGVSVFGMSGACLRRWPGARAVRCSPCGTCRRRPRIRRRASLK
jgi:VWFA-related protein